MIWPPLWWDPREGRGRPARRMTSPVTVVVVLHRRGLSPVPEAATVRQAKNSPQRTSPSTSSTIRPSSLRYSEMLP